MVNVVIRLPFLRHIDPPVHTNKGKRSPILILEWNKPRVTYALTPIIPGKLNPGLPAPLITDRIGEYITEFRRV